VALPFGASFRIFFPEKRTPSSGWRMGAAAAGARPRICKGAPILLLEGDSNYVKKGEARPRINGDDGSAAPHSCGTPRSAIPGLSCQQSEQLRGSRQGHRFAGKRCGQSGLRHCRSRSAVWLGLPAARGAGLLRSVDAGADGAWIRNHPFFRGPRFNRTRTPGPSNNRFRSSEAPPSNQLGTVWKPVNPGPRHRCRISGAGFDGLQTEKKGAA